MEFHKLLMKPFGLFPALLMLLTLLTSMVLASLSKESFRLLMEFIVFKLLRLLMSLLILSRALNETSANELLLDKEYSDDIGVGLIEWEEMTEVSEAEEFKRTSKAVYDELLLLVLVLVLVLVLLVAMMLSPVFKFWLYLFRIIAVWLAGLPLVSIGMCMCAVFFLSQGEPNVRLLSSVCAIRQGCVCCLSVCRLVLSVYLTRGSRGCLCFSSLVLSASNNGVWC